MKGKVLVQGLVLLTCLMMLSVSNVMAQPCNGDFCKDGDVDAEDVTEFLVHFGRSLYNNPCPPDAIWKVLSFDSEESIQWTDSSYNKNYAWGMDQHILLDKQTGLIWNEEHEEASLNWRDAVLHCYNVNDGGVQGWRLPTVEELKVLNESFNGPGQTLLLYGGRHWSSTTYTGSSDYAYTVDMGTPSDVYYHEKIFDTFHALCVRGGNGRLGQ